MDENMNGYGVVAKQTISSKIANFLFPQSWLDPAEEQPGMAAGELSTDIYIEVSIIDRLRLMVSGKAVVRVRTQSDVPVNKAISRSTFSVRHPWA